MRGRHCGFDFLVLELPEVKTKKSSAAFISDKEEAEIKRKSHGVAAL
jgi:hypothetical protein